MTDQQGEDIEHLLETDRPEIIAAGTLYQLAVPSRVLARGIGLGTAVRMEGSRVVVEDAYEGKESIVGITDVFQLSESIVKVLEGLHRDDWSAPSEIEIVTLDDLRCAATLDGSRCGRKRGHSGRHNSLAAASSPPEWEL